MKSNIPIVEGGGWITHQTTTRPRARFFGFVAVIWLAVSLCAASVFWNGWPSSFSYLEFLGIAVLVAQAAFTVLAVAFFFTERPRTRVEPRRDPAHDGRKLH